MRTRPIVPPISRYAWPCLAIALALSACDRPPSSQATAAPALTALLPAGDKPRITGGPNPAVAVTASQSIASGTTPFANGCDGVAVSGTLYPGAEVEPFVAVDPLDPQTMVGVWQQDRWSDGSARGLVSATTRDGGRSWRPSWRPSSSEGAL